MWFLNLNDTFGAHQITTRAKFVINCAGVWTDEVNEEFDIQSPYKHVFSKGVFISFKRPSEHRVPLIFETGQYGDALTYMPWGPVSLCGPTETMTKSISEGFKPMPGDVQFLLDHANKNLKSNFEKSHIFSLRCGIRPLAVKRSFDRDCYPLDISRRHKIVKDPKLAWISTYGGKLTGCISLSEKISVQISKYISPSLPNKEAPKKSPEEVDWSTFTGLQEKVPSLEWCMQNEFCCNIEDYMRRRTNISQWVPREGLGFNDENLPYLRKLALKLSFNNNQKAEKMLKHYIENVNSRFDQVIREV